MARQFYALTAENAKRYRPEIIGHFDLIVKNNEDGLLFDEESPAYRAAALESLHRCHATGGIFELNTGGIFRGYRKTPYPADFLLRELTAIGGRVTVNGDAHIYLSYQFLVLGGAGAAQSQWIFHRLALGRRRVPRTRHRRSRMRGGETMQMLLYDQPYYERGVCLLCGVDEAGRGPLAGPVFAAAVILPPGLNIEGLNDSKKLTEKEERVPVPGDPEAGTGLVHRPSG